MSRVDDLLEEMFADEEGPGDSGALLDAAGQLAAVIDSVASASHGRRVDKLSSEFSVFLAEQTAMLSDLMENVNDVALSSTSAASADVRESVQGFIARMDAYREDAARQNAALMERMAQLAAVISQPRRRTPVRDEHGEIVSVRDEPWT